MTPEEKAVIEAAIWWSEHPDVPSRIELQASVRTLIYSCPQCNAGGHTCPGDGNPISHTATDCGGHAEYGSLPPIGPEDDLGVYGIDEHAEPYSVENPETDPPPLTGPIWAEATFLYVLAGDRIRIGTDETDVLRSSSGAWHANVVSSVMPSGKVWDKITPWEHTELRLDLSANPGFREYPADTPCEILCTPERLAVLTLMTVFPGTKEIKP